MSKREKSQVETYRRSLEKFGFDPDQIDEKVAKYKRSLKQPKDPKESGKK
jgi:hypothetical protein